MTILKSPCGKEKSRKGNAFTVETLEQHISTCPSKECSDYRKKHKPKEFPGEGLPTPEDIDPLGILDDDMPDGAYWAMWHETYGPNLPH